MDTKLIHLPAVIADQFGIPRSEARRRIALGRVKINGEVMTDLDIDLDAIPPGDVRFELECRPVADALVQILDANAQETRRMNSNNRKAP